MLRIRLTRTGKKHQPNYRIVVAEHSRPVKGKFIEIVGHYIPTQKPKVLEIKQERIQYWISKGAVPSDTVQNLLVDKGVLTQKRDIRYARVKSEEKAEKKPVAATTETDSADKKAENSTEEDQTIEVTDQVEVTSADAVIPEATPEEKTEAAEESEIHATTEETA